MISKRVIKEERTTVVNNNFRIGMTKCKFLEWMATFRASLATDGGTRDVSIYVWKNVKKLQAM
jgi:hypothetical protein